MKHAGPQALDALEDLLAKFRTIAELKEKKRGSFYWKSSAFLHFHEDPAGMFADLKIGDAFERFPVNNRAERQALVARAKALVARC